MGRMSNTENMSSGAMSSIEVKIPLGCLSGSFLGIRRPGEGRHRPSSGFLDVTVSPWRAGPWAMRSPSWISAHDELSKRIVTSGTAGGLLLFGEDYSIECFLSSAARTAGDYCLEMDLTRAVDKWAVNTLIGAEPGYIGHSPEGSEFSKKLSSLTKAAKEWSAGHEAHRPCPVVIFRNIHRASPEVQQIVERLATRGELPLPSGNCLQCEGLLVIATSPRVYPPWASSTTASRFMETTVHPNGQRLLFDPSIAANFHPMVFPPAGVLDFAAACSMEIGRVWASHLPPSTFAHHRIVAGPELTGRIISKALVGNSDTKLSRLAEKVRTTAHAEIDAAKNAPLPQSLTVPARWCFMVELENDLLWAEPCPVEEISNMQVRLSLPHDTAESLGVSVPPYYSWNNPQASSVMEERVIGQDSNVSDIAEKIELYASSAERQKPLFSALLLGPTGTGKTHLAKTLASAYGRNLIKIDCSTLQDESLLQEAIFGFTPDSLASQLALHRASVVLLDEIDKAHRSIWFLLMQALDEGVMKSSTGREDVKLAKSVILATSNQLAEELSGHAIQFADRPRQDVDAALRSILREGAVINEACVERFDAVYFMAPLRGSAAVKLWSRILLEEFNLFAAPRVVESLIAQHGDILGSSGARAVKRACAEITTRAHEWGMRVENGCLILDPQSIPLSRRQKLWLKPSENRAVFQSSSTHPWAAELIQEVFMVNAGKTNPKGPQAAILLVGPTGSGKTYLPQELSKLMGKGDALIVDCSASPSLEESTSHLFGEPGIRRGYLTENLLHQPDRIVVFDEIDKAPHGLLDQLLSVLDQGRAVDRHAGSIVDMRQAAFFFTSNAMTGEMQELCELVGDPTPDSEKPKMVALDACHLASQLLQDSAMLRPEQASRLDLVIPFGLPSSSGIREHSMRVIEGVLEEYSLGTEYGSVIAKSIPEQMLCSLDSRMVRREASRLVSELLRKQRADLDKNGQVSEDSPRCSVYEKFGKEGVAVL
jgi:ATP-dependent Clp protease ATP-binding subunit ClpA